MRPFGGNNRQQQNDGIAGNVTMSESDEEESIPEDNVSAVSSDSGALKMQMPTGYLLGDRPTRRSPTSSPKEGDNQDVQRLVLLAKHPNVTDEEAAQAINRQQKKHRPLVSFADTPSHRGNAQQAQQQSSTQMDQAAFAAQMASAREEDFDEVWTAENQSAEQYDAQPKSFFGKIMEKLFPPQAGPSQEISLASHSLASESTRKISNVDENARRERIRKELGHLTCKERFDMGCHRLVSTRTGMMTLCLLGVLFIAMVVIVTAAVVSSRDDSLTGASEATTMIPRPGFGGTITSSPTGDPTNSLTAAPSIRTATPSPTDSPTDSPVPEETIEVTSAPTFVPSKQPSSAPTKPPTTKFPTVTPTPQPSPEPTAQPSGKPTPRPTPAPTQAPTTPSPTVFPTTSMPSAAPTVTFLDTPFQAVGEALFGSQAEQRFGHSLALSADGRFMAVGAPDTLVDRMEQAGRVQVYQWSNRGEWITRGPPLVGRNPLDQFGGSIALSHDGSVLVASEPTYSGTAGDRSGNVRVFVWSPFNRYEPLGQQLEGVAASDNFGVSVAMSADGRRLAVGAPHHDLGNRNVAGEVTVFELRDNVWARVGNPIPGVAHLDWFGWTVDLSDDGSVVAVGAPRNLLYGGYVNCYSLVDGDWEQLGNTIRNSVEPLRYDDNFGHAIRLSGNTRIVIGSPGKNGGARDAGLVAVYELDNDGDEWSLLGNTISSSQPRDQLGFSVDLKGDILVVGIPGRNNQGQVDFFQYDASSDAWERHPDSLQGEAGSNFGSSVRLTASLAVGSAITSGTNTGSVAVFRQS